MADVKGLLNKERAIRNRLIKSIDNGKQTISETRSKGFYEAKLSEIRRTWLEYEKIDQLINEFILETPPEGTLKYISDDTFSKLETIYCNYIGTLYDAINPTTELTDSTLLLTQQIRVEQQQNILPKITLPKYNGDYDGWRSFHDLYVAVVHNNTSLKDVQKLYYLKGSLIGDAEKLLRHTPITNEDYLPAWNKLKARYENKKILVNHQLKILTSQSKLNIETTAGLKSLIDTSEECLQQLKSLQVDISTWDVLLIYLIVQKLPFITLRLWEEHQGASQELPKYRQFSSFLDNRLKILEALTDTLAPRTSHAKSGSKPTTTKTYHVVESTKPLYVVNMKCSACNDKHLLQNCKKYQKMDIKSRKWFIKSNGHCYNCLSKKHSLKECNSRHRCLKCKQRHHTTIHEDVTANRLHQDVTANRSHQDVTANRLHQKDGEAKNLHSRSVESEDKVNRVQQNNSDSNDCIQGKSCNRQGTGGSQITQTYMNRERSSALLSTALVKAQGANGKPLILRCLIDPGSECSFITQSASHRLQANCKETLVVVTGLNKSPMSNVNKQTKLNLQSCGSNETAIEENFLIINKVTDSLPTTPITKESYQHLDNLELADPTYWKPGKIDALLGAKVYARIVQEGIVRSSNKGPTAINTMFGWILIGTTEDVVNDDSVQTFMATTDNIDTQLRQFWEIEEVSSKPILSQEETLCQDIFQDTFARLKSGRYQVKLPFINNMTPRLGNSRHQAIQRFEHLQRQFLRKPEFKLEYERCLDEYIELGHMEPVNPPCNDEQHYYIPHHAVFKDSSTTKLRVVFDASAKTTNGRSLNQHLLKGPTLQPTLYNTLLTWRKFKVVMNADIEKMYRMIEMHPDHRTFQKIVWRNPTTGVIQDYQLKTVTFGTTSAPYLAIRTLQQLAIDEKYKWPLAAEAVYTNFYVDDLLSGADDLSKAKELQQQLIQMMTSAGFKLRKWASNVCELLQDLPADHIELKNSLIFSNTESIKTLGIKWFPKEDYFTFIIKPFTKPLAFTKRIILSQIASLYDPIGWLAPIIIEAKIIMQGLWITGSSWDEPVSENIQKSWTKFTENLQVLEQLRIPRWIQYSTGLRMQLHGFCDASSKAYAAAIYLRVEHFNGEITSHLVTAKTKVAPLKPTTIPRLELNGALLLTRLMKVIIQGMQVQDIPIITWTDSQIVLQWLKDHPSKWKIYIANRVAEIQETLKFKQWRHIASIYNPADLASRGISANQLLHNESWWHGPTWLLQPPDKWPNNYEVTESTTLEEKTPTVTSFLINLEDNILLKYSTFTRLVRITALIQRFIHNCRNPNNKRVNVLTSSEYTKAQKTIFKLVQQTAFTKEYQDLVQHRPLSKQSKIIRLNPMLDRDGLIRVGGRLEHALVSYDRKHPVILPRDHHVTWIYIDKVHLETLHGNTSLVLNTIRNSVWILDGRRCITSRLHRCITCFKQRQASMTQQMGNLPSARVNITRPFSRIGIDYAGPVMVKSSKLRNAKVQKAYFCIFICMATKAVHIELVSDMTSEAFIAALKRFVSRRGLCTEIYSDCGTNFIGGKIILDKELQQAIKQAWPQAAEYLADKSISWHMNPPAAPHFGGLWESGVKSIKYHLRRSIGNSNLTFEEYVTLLTQIEACLNSRPLCRVNNDPSDQLVLTPVMLPIARAS